MSSTTRIDGQILFMDGAADTPLKFVRRYIAATHASQQAMNAKMAGLMVSYLEDPANL